VWFSGYDRCLTQNYENHINRLVSEIINFNYQRMNLNATYAQQQQQKKTFGKYLNSTLD